MTISKSDYMRFRECPKDAWMYIHRNNIYKSLRDNSAFKQLIFSYGNEIDVLARELFPFGVLINSKADDAKDITKSHIINKTQILFQPVFESEGFHAEVDILEYNPDTDSYTVYEVKSKTKVVNEHLYDLAFQVNLLRMCGLKIEKVVVKYVNNKYVRNGSLSKLGLFIDEDVTEKVEKFCDVVKSEMYDAFNFLSNEEFSEGCGCIYKGRSAHCVCFSILNPSIPAYGIHDISYIGNQKALIREWVDNGILTFADLPTSLNLKKFQQNQIDTYNSDFILTDRHAIAEELDKLQFPLYFIDYETLNPAIPRFEGYRPYRHIPFQYSLYVLDTPTSEPRFLEFLHTEHSDPSKYFVESLKKHIGDTGSIIVWYESFEGTRNSELGKLFPEHDEYMQSLNKRIYDLRNIFVDQLYVHKDFLGKTSIKNVLPVMVPELSYKELDIRDGGMASTAWNKLMTEELSAEEKEKIVSDLKKYCGLDAYAMYAIWKKLTRLSIANEISTPKNSLYGPVNE